MDKMTTPRLDAAAELMTKLGVKPTQAAMFIEVIRNPALIIDKASLIKRFLDAGYDEQAATALALFLLDEKANGRGRYAKINDLPGLIEQEVQRVLLRWVKWVVAPIGGFIAFLWATITHWDNVTAFFRSVGK